MSVSNIFDNDFEPRPLEDYGLYGVETFGDSFIKFHDKIWKFLYFQGKSNIAVYIDKTGEFLEICLEKAQNVTRMQICTPKN